MIRRTPGIRPSVVKDHRDDAITALNAEIHRLRAELELRNIRYDGAMVEQHRQDGEIEDLRALNAELLAALKELVASAENSDQDSGWYNTRSIEALEVARAVIEKAEGRG